MRATSDDVQAIIRRLSRTATASAIPLYEAIETAADTHVDKLLTGKVLIGTASGGTSVSFALPPLDGVSSGDISRALNRILNAADTLLAADPTLTDAELRTELLAAFPRITAVHADFSVCR